MLYPITSLVYILFPCCQLSRSVQQPLTRFINGAASFITFLGKFWILVIWSVVLGYALSREILLSCIAWNQTCHLLQNLLMRDKPTLRDICTVLWTMFSTMGKYQQYCEGYHQYIGVVQYCGRYPSILWRVFSTVRDIFSILEGVQYCEGYHQYIGGCSVMWRDTISNVGMFCTAKGYHQYCGGRCNHQVPHQYYEGHSVLWWNIIRTV